MNTPQETGSASLSVFEMMMRPAINWSRRDTIIVAATRVFLRQGYEKASMELVAREAGVARRTLYNQFAGGKEALFQVVVERMWSSFPVLHIVSQADSQACVETGLRRIASAVASFWSSPLSVDFLRMIIAEGRNFPYLTESFFRHGKIPAMQAVRLYLEQQAEKGTLHISDSERAARQFLGLIDEPLLWIRVLGKNETHTEDERLAVTEEAVSMFVNYYRSPQV